jgi:hypothetical protein
MHINHSILRRAKTVKRRKHCMNFDARLIHDF